MKLFTQHDATTATGTSATVLARVKERYGFIPNLAACLAESPVTLGAVLDLTGAFDRTSFSERERQIILLTVSVLNGCSYCQTVHTGLARRAQIDEPTLQAVQSLGVLPDTKENELRDFARTVVESRGWVREDTVQRFLAAGYTRAQVFECLLGIALKNLTNFSNHITGAEPNPEFVAMARMS